MNQKITKNMGIMEAVSIYPDSIKIFQQYGMHCLGCMASQFENIEQGCIAHGIDADVMCDAINDEMNNSQIDE